MISRSFVDLLFILLCAAIVMLANSSPLRVAEADPAKAAGGGTLDLAGRELRLLVVGETELWIGEELVDTTGGVRSFVVEETERRRVPQRQLAG